MAVDLGIIGRLMDIMRGMYVVTADLLDIWKMFAKGSS